MKLIDKITPETLNELYWHQKMSSPGIAEIYHCHPKTIRRKLKKYGIRVRTMSEATKNSAGIKIPKEGLRKLYLEKKMTTYKIAEKFKCCQMTVYNRLLEYGIPSRTPREAALLREPRYPRRNFSGDLEEKAYLIGFRVGDLSVHTQSEDSPTIYVRASSTKPEFVKLMKRLFSPYGHVWSKSVKGQFNIKCYLNRSLDFLLDNRDLIKPWILKSSKYFAAFLAGYADAEGSFCICNGQGTFEIDSQDKNILHQIRAKLINLGILLRPPRIARKKGTRTKNGIMSNEDIWKITMRRKDALLKLTDLIGPYLKHVDKQRGVKIVKDNILERNRKYGIPKGHRGDKLYLKEGIKI